MQLGANNVYLLGSPGGFVCIDAGPDYEGAWDELVAQLAGHGATPGDVRAVILTHSHLDHAGMAARWQREGTRIYAGRGDEGALALDDEGRRELRALAVAALRAHGVPDEMTRVPATRRALSRSADEEGDWPAPLRMTPITPDCLLDDGDEVPEAGVRLRVLACPGHTPGTLVVSEGVPNPARPGLPTPTAGTASHRRGGCAPPLSTGRTPFPRREGGDRVGSLYTGDHLLPRTVATVGIQFEGEQRRPSMPAFVRSLERLRSWTGVAGWPGHGDAIDDAGVAAEWSLRYIEQRAERLRRRLADGPGTAYDLALRQLPHLTPEHIWPVMAETIGLLDLLVERGDVLVEQDGSRMVFHANAAR